jgi:hypothetical protein
MGMLRCGYRSSVVTFDGDTFEGPGGKACTTCYAPCGSIHIPSYWHLKAMLDICGVHLYRIHRHRFPCTGICVFLSPFLSPSCLHAKVNEAFI